LLNNDNGKILKCSTSRYDYIWIEEMAKIIADEVKNGYHVVSIESETWLSGCSSATAEFTITLRKEFI